MNAGIQELFDPGRLFDSRRKEVYHESMPAKRVIFVGSVPIGAGHPVVIQSMTKTAPDDVQGTLEQINRLKAAGCRLIRVALPAAENIRSFRAVVSASSLPVIADIHFDHRLALAAMEAGAAAVRINPGNIGSRSKVREILEAAAERGVALRIGVNSGSLEKKYLNPQKTLAEQLTDSLLDHVRFCEDCGFFNLKLSVKTTTVRDTIAAYRHLDRLLPYPLHLGLTEAGPFLPGTVKSVLALGNLLMDGIGNTIRVSLTADPVQEVLVARELLKALGLLQEDLEIISCPTCARTSVDLLAKVEEFQVASAGLKPPRPLRVAIMGCEVNGPGEAAHADIGLAFSRSRGFLFRKGRIVGQVDPERAVAELLALVMQPE